MFIKPITITVATTVVLRVAIRRSRFQVSLRSVSSDKHEDRSRVFARTVDSEYAARPRDFGADWQPPDLKEQTQPRLPRLDRAMAKPR